MKDWLMGKQVKGSPLLTPHQVAKLLHVPIKTIRKMIDRKQLLAFKVGRHWRIPRSELSKKAKPTRDM
jgi:excisionase family DNA binding protein